MLSRFLNIYNLILLAAIFCVPILRENLFIEINKILSNDVFKVNSDFSLFIYLSKLNISALQKLKWVFTIIFIGIELLLSFFLIKRILNDKEKLIFICKLFSFLILSLIIVSIVLILFFDKNIAYTFTRKVVGIVQSPIPFIFILSMYLYLEKN